VVNNGSDVSVLSGGLVIQPALVPIEDSASRR